MRKREGVADADFLARGVRVLVAAVAEVARAAFAAFSAVIEPAEYAPF